MMENLLTLDIKEVRTSGYVGGLFSVTLATSDILISDIPQNLHDIFSSRYTALKT